MVRSVESRALHVLRQIDENAGKFSEGELTAQVPQDVAIYLLNQKRAQLAEIEARTGVTILVEIDNELTAMEMALILPNQTTSNGVSRMEGDPTAALDEAEGGKRKRRRRGGRNRKKSDDDGENNEVEAAEVDATDTVEDDDADNQNEVEASEDDEDKPKRRRRRGRRGGRNRRRKGDDEASDTESDDEALAADGEEPQKIIIEVKTDDDLVDASVAEEDAPQEANELATADLTDDGEAGSEMEADVAEDDAEAPDDDKPKKRGWWQR